MIKSFYAPGIDGQFCELMENWLPKIDYWPRELKYCGKELAKEMPNGTPDKNFFEKWSNEIFRKPHNRYKKDKDAERFLSLKKEAMLKFLRYLRKYSFTEFGPRALTDVYFRDLDELMVRLVPERHRDHVLHQGNVFLLGLLCYRHSSFVRQEHKNMLNTRPEPPGCIALDKTMEFQFFEQWFNSAAIHDVGYIFEILAERAEFDFIDEVISSFNNRWLKTIMSSVSGLAVPSSVYFDRNLRKLNVGDLYEVKYCWPGEDHLTKGNLWRGALMEIEKMESRAGPKADHGICTAKVLLKTGNVLVKWQEVNKEANPSARFSYRNYVLPALAVARHNLQPKMVSANDNTAFECLKKDFENEFLACLTTLCDEASEFDRKVAGNLRLGINLQAEITDSDPQRFRLRLKQL